MLNGLFKLWFKSAKGDGGSVCVFKDGRIAGGGTLMWYTGHYDQKAMNFWGEVRVKRHAQYAAPLFGLDEFALMFEGLAYGQYAQFTARVRGHPELQMEGTLTRLTTLYSGLVFPLPIDPAQHEAARAAAI